MQEVLKGYKGIFEASEKWSKKVDLEKEFEVFREGSAVYHFLGGNNSPHLRLPDKEALDKGRLTDLILFNSFLSQGKSQLGYSSHRPMDAVESRHLMMMTLLFSSIGLEYKHIVEIGGGFGNWTRIATGIVGFDKWTIIDLPFVIELQKWFLKQELRQQDYEKIEFVSTDNYTDWKEGFEGADLVIGAHSLNEFSLEDFQEYFDCVVSKCENFFYASPINGPSKELVSKKSEIINEVFKSKDVLMSEDERVFNIVYEKNED